MNRAAIKQRGKAAFKANYWKTVLVAFLLSLALGAYGASASSSVDEDELQQAFTDQPAQSVSYNTESEVLLDPFSEIDQEDINADLSPLMGSTQSQDQAANASSRFSGVVSVGTLGTLGSLGLLLTIFLFGPLEVSCRNFFRKNLNDPAELDELNAGFVPKYWHNLATMLLKKLFVFLWSLLLIIPGIIMTYAYEMTPYILNDHPELGAMDAIRRSKEMMKGHKWELFVFDLSFLGWFLLSIITFGLADIFYVHPYYSSSHAAFYENLKAQAGEPTPVTDLPQEA